LELGKLEPKSPQLKDGSEWVDHEDCIVGDEAGLRNLIAACEIAIAKSEYYGNDLGDYVGVKKLDTEWFVDPNDTPQTRIENGCLTIVLGALVGLIGIGIYAVFNWIF
jgi:hypothetical protein